MVLIALIGLVFGVKIGKYSVKETDLKSLMKLPQWWMVHDLSQDIVTGAWNMVVISIHENDDNGTARAVGYFDALSILEALNGVRANIEAKEYLEIPKMVDTPS